MGTKVRKQIYLEERQDRLLRREARAQGVSQAELIRRTIEAGVTQAVRGGTNPAAFDAVLRLARRRTRARLGGAEARKRKEAGVRSRDDLYEERIARDARRVPD